MIDELLKCYFECSFENLAKDALRDRYKRQEIMEYTVTIIRGCSGDSPELEQENTSRATKFITNHHAKNREKNGNICLMGKNHDILYVVLKLAFVQNLADSKTINDLLANVFECEKTFERLFAGAIFGTKPPYLITGWKSDFETQTENYEALIFFVRHSSAARSGFVYDRRYLRMIDVPLDSCGRANVLMLSVQLGLPKLVLEFLRHGAVIYLDIFGQDPIDHLLELLGQYGDAYPLNLVMCLQILMRAVAQIQLRQYLNKSPYGFTENLGDFVKCKYPKLLENGVLPPGRCGLIPAELKHLCRCKIRNVLWENHQLPLGIDKLMIPEILKVYVDIRTN